MITKNWLPRPGVVYRAVVACLRTLDRQRHAHAAADAQRSQALLRAAPLHFVQQRHEDAAALRADRMTDRDRAAVDVGFGKIDARSSPNNGRVEQSNQKV